MRKINLNILVLALVAVVWGPRAAEASFLDDFNTPGLVNYTGTNSYGSGGYFTISGGKLNITTGADNTYSVMTTGVVPFPVGEILSLDVPAISGTEGVFMMCSTWPAQPNGSSTFGFRFRRGGGIVRIDLYPGGAGTNTADPCSLRPAILMVTRTSDTGFNYSIKIEGAETPLGSFNLPNLAGNYNLHIGAQAYKQTSGTTFAFDNLSVQPRIHNVTRDIWYDTIQLSIDDANDGDHIEVAPGIYHESLYLDGTYLNGKAVHLYSTDGPSVTTIDGTGYYHVVHCVNDVDANTILEGFTITGGNASGTSSPSCDGGGMFNDGSSPTVTNCIFISNSAGYGGGMYNGYGSNPAVIDCNFSNNSVVYFGGGMFNKQSNPTVTDCNFSGNSADYDGGGMYNDSSSPTVTDCNFYENTAAALGGGGMYSKNGSSPTVTNCNFSMNTGTNRGGGMYNDSSSPTVTDCNFSGNTADDDGGGMYNYNSSPTVTNCIFISNSAGYGGGMYNNSSSPTVTDCNFSGNSADHGGGMYNSSSSPTVTNCTFSGNTADDDGGGMYNSSSSPTVTDCNFSGNSATSWGGGMYNSSYSSPTVTNCTFINNQSVDSGGGMYNSSSSPTITNCTFSGNSADFFGGGMYNYYDSSPTVTDCNFRGNSADHGGGMYNRNSSSPTVTGCSFSGNTSEDGGGGGMYNYFFSSPTVTNCTFSGNSADSGGGMYNDNSSSPTVTNCNFSGNTAVWYGGGMCNFSSSPMVTNCILWNDAPDEIYNTDSTPTVAYSDIQGGGYSDANNINADPCFIDANSGDLRLKPNSPCIDAGNNTAVPGSVLKDLAGKLRFADDPYTPDTGNAGTTGRPVVDMGAYEFQGCGAIPQNLLANPGFETGTPTGWITNWGWSLTATAVQVHDGNYSGLASGRTDSWQGAWQSLLGLMDDGKTYRISGWVRLQNKASDHVALTVKKVDSTGDNYYGIDNATAYSDKWVNLDGTLIFDANESMTDLYVYFEGPAADVNFYVDDAAVTEVMGDMDHSGGIDFIDFALFASYYGFDCATQDCGRANLYDCDNAIKELDLAILLRDWLVGAE